MKLPKINLGIDKKRNFFDYSHHVNTTSDFGFCQPTLFQETVPDSDYKVSVKSAVRLAPLPQPTFGDIKVNHSCHFVKIQDVFEAFDNLQSQQTVQSAISSYIPDHGDFVHTKVLLSYLFKLGQTNYHNFFWGSDQTFSSLSKTFSAHKASE